MKVSVFLCIFVYICVFVYVGQLWLCKDVCSRSFHQCGNVVNFFFYSFLCILVLCCLAHCKTECMQPGCVYFFVFKVVTIRVNYCCTKRNATQTGDTNTNNSNWLDCRFPAAKFSYSRFSVLKFKRSHF